jgi:AraC family transcriptional regulator
MQIVNVFAPVRYSDGRPMLLAGLRRHHPFMESGRHIPDQWRQLEALGRIPGQVGDSLYGVMCGHNPSGIEFMCGAEVDSFAELPADLGRMRIEAQHYAVFVHSGPRSALLTTWERIVRDWLPGSGHQSAQAPDFEVHGRPLAADTGPDGVEIWISLARQA